MDITTIDLKARIAAKKAVANLKDKVRGTRQAIADKRYDLKETLDAIGTTK